MILWLTLSLFFFVRFRPTFFLSLSFRMIGLRALEGVVSSKALYACDHKAQLNLVLPAILDCLIDSKSGVHIAFPSTPDSPADPSIRRSVSIHVAVHPDNVVSDDDVTAEAVRCLPALFKAPNGTNVKLALGPTFTYLDEHSRWWPSTFGVRIIKAIVISIMPQYRYMVVNELVARIDGVDSTTPDLTLRLQKKATLIAALEAILVSSISLIGMPVLEILQSLLVTLTKSLSASSSLTKEGEASQLLSLEAVIQDGLIKSVGKLLLFPICIHGSKRETMTKINNSYYYSMCIGGLATHIYYSNQVPHIISHIIGKLSFKLGATPRPATIEDVPTVEYRETLLKCLQAVIKTSKDNGRQEASFHAAEISSDLLTPCLGLLLDENVEIRTSFAQVLVTFLVAEDESLQASAGSLTMTSPIPSTSGDLYFRAAAHQTLHAYASSSSLTPKDLVAIYGMLKALFAHFQDDEFIRVVPMLFSLQDACLQAPSEAENQDGLAVTRKRAVAAAIVAYFQMAVEIYGMTEPREYLENIKTSREHESQWVPIQYATIEESLAQTTEATWETPSEPLSPVLTHPLAREHLVTLLTTVSDRFRAGADRFGLIYNPESQSTLLATNGNRDFGSGVFLSTSTLNGAPGSLLGHKVERSMDSRIRISRHLEDWALPKIFPQTSTSSSNLSTTEEVAESITTRDGSLSGGVLTLNGSSLTLKKIGVDNLKAALVAAHQAADASIGGAAGQKVYPLSIHTQTLRKQHGATASTMSTTSNLASSRPDLADLLNTIQVNEVSTSSGSRLSLVVPPY